jgi:hypothetical protein
MRATRFYLRISHRNTVEPVIHDKLTLHPMIWFFLQTLNPWSTYDFII